MSDPKRRWITRRELFWYGCGALLLCGFNVWVYLTSDLWLALPAALLFSGLAGAFFGPMFPNWYSNEPSGTRRN